jgi:hypothetical protein
VLILKRVKVVCFDTLLQVLILKGVSVGDGGFESRALTNSAGAHSRTEIAISLKAGT